MERLNIRMIGDLTAKTEAELLAVKNFGQTSLNEIKQRLGELGLALRADAAGEGSLEGGPEARSASFGTRDEIEDLSSAAPGGELGDDAE